MTNCFRQQKTNKWSKYVVPINISFQNLGMPAFTFKKTNKKTKTQI